MAKIAQNSSSTNRQNINSGAVHISYRYSAKIPRSSFWCKDTANEKGLSKVFFTCMLAAKYL